MTTEDLFRRIIKERQRNINSFIWRGMSYTNVWNPVWNTITSRSPVGTNIYDRDWDLLIILDACRTDVLQDVSVNKDYGRNIGQVSSVGSMTAEWHLNTFTQEHRSEIGNTALISGALWSDMIFNKEYHLSHNNDYTMYHRGFPSWNPVDADAFSHYELVHPDLNQVNRLHHENGAIPHVLTDRAIDVGRKRDYERTIVHYTLPHLKFIADAIDWEAGNSSMTELMRGLDALRDLRPEESSYKPGKNGDISRNKIYELYKSNLLLVLDYVEILLDNFDAEKVVISSDHGEALGDGWTWGHPWGCQVPEVKKVPWALTTATDQFTYDTQHKRADIKATKKKNTEFLENMGYI